MVYKKKNLCWIELRFIKFCNCHSVDIYWVSIRYKLYAITKLQGDLLTENLYDFSLGEWKLF